MSENRPSSWLDETYRLLVGSDVPRTSSIRQRCIAVMKHWDGRLIDGDKRRETAAIMALCRIGLNWHAADHYPYTLEQVTERLRELMPELGASEITGRTLHEILHGRHPSQYASRARA